MSHPLKQLENRVQEDPSAAATNLPDLLRYLESGTPEEKAVASSIYADLAKQRPSKAVSTLDQTVPALQSYEPPVRANVAAVFAYVARAHPSAIVAIEEEGQVTPIKNLEALLDDNHDMARNNAAEAIALLAQDTPGAVASTLHAKGFGRLFTANDKSRRYALAICSCVAEVDPEQVHPHLRNIRACVTASISPAERVTALATLVHVAASTPKVVANNPEPLFEAATASDESVRANALAVLAVLAKSYPSAVMDARTVAANSLESGGRSERVNAAELLAELAGSSPDHVEFARETLERARDRDSEEVVQTYAEVALVKLDGGDDRPQTEIGSLVEETFPGTNLTSVIEEGLQPIIQIGELFGSKQHVEDSVVGGGIGNHSSQEDTQRTNRRRSDPHSRETRNERGNNNRDDR